MSTHRRVIAAAFGILLLLAGWDFFSRVYVGRDEALHRVDVPTLAVVKSRPGAEGIRQNLVTWMPSLAGVSGAAANPSDPNGWALALLGIFRKGAEPFAVLYAQPLAGGNPSIERVVVGDVTHGRKVEEIGSRTVRLKQGDSIEELAIFKPGQKPPRLASTQSAGGAVDGRPRPSQNRSSGSGARQDSKYSATPVMGQRSERKKQRQSPAAAQSSTQQTAPVSSASPAPRAPAGAAPSAAPSGVAAGAKVSQPLEQRPGQKPELPWNLPVESSTTPVDAGSAAAKSTRLPPPPPPPPAPSKR